MCIHPFPHVLVTSLQIGMYVLQIGLHHVRGLFVISVMMWAQYRHLLG